jgi:hypothetical protein
MPSISICPKEYFPMCQFYTNQGLGLGGKPDLPRKQKQCNIQTNSTIFVFWHRVNNPSHICTNYSLLNKTI